MAVVKVKPTSPGQRAVVKVVHKHLHKGKPEASLLEPQKQNAGRNNNGHITTRHKGGGHKHHYRVVDFRRNKDGIAAKVERIEYDPNRTAHIALLCYADGERRYIIAPKGVKAGAVLMSGSEAPIKAGNTLPLRNIPVGTTIHCIEMQPGKGAQLARSAGASVQLLAREGSYAQLRLRSGEIRRVHVDCRATIGEVGNEEHQLKSIGKAGAKRWKGIRPTVRGVAMNPVDHPHGGGEGKTAAGRDPVSPWGTPTKGYRTRRNKRTNNMIVRRRLDRPAARAEARERRQADRRDHSLQHRALPLDLALRRHQHRLRQHRRPPRRQVSARSRPAASSSARPAPRPAGVSFLHEGLPHTRGRRPARVRCGLALNVIPAPATPRNTARGIGDYRSRHMDIRR